MSDKKVKIKSIDWKVLWDFFKPYKLQANVFLAFTFIAGFLESLNLAVLYPVMNYGIENKGTDNVLLKNLNSFVESINYENKFFVACVILIVVSLVAALARIVYQYFANVLTVRIIGDTQRKVFEKLASADYVFYTRNKQGALIHSATIAPQSVSSIILSVIKFVFNAISSLLLFSLLITLSWQGTAALLTLGFIYGVFIKRIMRKVIYDNSDVVVAENRKMNVYLNEMITGIKTIKVFSVISHWRKKYLASVEKGLASHFRLLMGRVYPEIGMKLVFFIIIGSVGIVLSSRPTESIMALLPVFGTFIIVAQRFFTSAQLVGNSLMNIAEAMPNTKVVHDLCNEKVREKEQGKQGITKFEEAICFNQVSFQYDKDSAGVLNNINFKIKKNQITALVGTSGSGKTTIINLLLKLYSPDSGQILIDGRDIFSLTDKSYLQLVSYVGQETFIFNNTIRENICFGLENCTDEMIEEAARLANAHEFIEKTAKGYETMVGDSGMKLSGGQRQRIAIARAILRQPQILVLDEATSSLDNISEKKVQEAINNIAKNITVLVIAHRLSTVKNADKIIILQHGEIKEQGDHEQLISNKDIYYKLYSVTDAHV